MQYRSAVPFALSVLLAAAPCGPAARDGRVEPWTSRFRTHAGRVTATDLALDLPRVLARHGFFIETVDRGYGAVEMLTQWKEREPFAEELAEGARLARTRLKLRATWTGRLYQLRFEAENMVLDDAGSWRPAPMTDAFEDYAREVADDVRLELASGIRTY